MGYPSLGGAEHGYSAGFRAGLGWAQLSEQTDLESPTSQRVARRRLARLTRELRRNPAPYVSTETLLDVLLGAGAPDPGEE